MVYQDLELLILEAKLYFHWPILLSMKRQVVGLFVPGFAHSSCPLLRFDEIIL